MTVPPGRLAAAPAPRPVAGSDLKSWQAAMRPRARPHAAILARGGPQDCPLRVVLHLLA